VGFCSISWVPSALSRCSWGSSGVCWCMVGFPFVSYSRRKLDQKHFFMFSLPLVVCSIPCHQCMSCWAWERNCSSVVLGFLPMNKLTLSMNAFILWVTGAVPSGGSIFHCCASLLYALVMLSVLITHRLQPSPDPCPIPYQGFDSWWELKSGDILYLCLRWYRSSFWV